MEENLEAPLSSHGGNRDDTSHLLRDILTELRSIGGQLRHQDDRLNQVERKLGLRIDSFESNDSKEIDLVKSFHTTPRKNADHPKAQGRRQSKTKA
jgi:hypothetical protein